MRWAADIVFVIAAVIWVWSHTERSGGGISDHLDHLHSIVVAGGTLLGRSVLAVGPRETTLALVVLAAIAIAGVAVWLRDRASTGSSPLTRWLLLGTGGLVVAALGWAMYVPAVPYYTPSVYGVQNRVNALASVGLVLIVYAACGVLGTFASRLAGRSARTATIATAALALALGSTYAIVSHRHSDIWTDAYKKQASALQHIAMVFPRLPPHSTLFLSGYPAQRTVQVPIFSETWDLFGAVILHYRDTTLNAQPVIAGTRLVCNADGIQLVNPALPPGPTPANSGPYGSVYLVDIANGAHATPRSQAECRRVIGSFNAGPFFLSTSY